MDDNQIKENEKYIQIFQKRKESKKFIIIFLIGSYIVFYLGILVVNYFSFEAIMPYMIIGFCISVFIVIFVNYINYNIITLSCPKCGKFFDTRFRNLTEQYWNETTGFLFKVCPECGQILDLDFLYQTIENEKKNYRVCPFCVGKISNSITFCQHCGNNILEYDNKKIIVEEARLRGEIERRREIYKSLDDIFNDESLMKSAKELRRIYGKKVYISFLKAKAKELGIGEIEINENDIE